MIAENLTAVADSHMLIWRSWFPGPPVRQHGDQRRFSGAPLDCHEPELLELAYALPFPMTRHAFATSAAFDSTMTCPPLRQCS